MWYLALKIIPSKKSRKTIGGNPKKMIGDPRTKLATFPGGVPDHSGREIRGGAKWVAPCVGWCYSSLPRVRSGARSTALSLGQRIFFRELSNELPIATNWPGHSTVPCNGQKGVHFGSIDCKFLSRLYVVSRPWERSRPPESWILLRSFLGSFQVFVSPSELPTIYLV